MLGMYVISPDLNNAWTECLSGMEQRAEIKVKSEYDVAMKSRPLHENGVGCRGRSDFRPMLRLMSVKPKSITPERR